MVQGIPSYLGVYMYLYNIIYYGIHGYNLKRI